MGTALAAVRGPMPMQGVHGPMHGALHGHTLQVARAAGLGLQQRSVSTSAVAAVAFSGRRGPDDYFVALPGNYGFM